MAKKSSKKIKKSNKKNYKKGYKKIAFFVVFFLIIVLIINIKNSKIKLKNDNTQLIFNNENITLNLEKDILIEDGNIYLSFEDVSRFLDNQIYKEESTGLIITTSTKKIATLKQEDNSITINGSNVQLKSPVIEKKGNIYIAISELESVYDYNFAYNEISNIVVIDSLNKKCIKAYTKKNIKVKKENKAFSNIVEKIKKGQWLYFIEEENNIAKVRTQNGNIGYVKMKNLYNFITEREDFIEQIVNPLPDKILEYDITKKDISTFEKRQNIMNLILQQAIKNDKIYAKIVYNGENNIGYERFKIEVIPYLKECGINTQV